MKFFLWIFLILSLQSFADFREEYDSELARIEREVEVRLDEDPTTVGTKKALGYQYDELDKLLNKYYKELMKSLDKDSQEALKESQRKWIEYRDKELKFSNEFYGKKDGTMWQLFTPGRAVELIENRVREIGYYLHVQKVDS